MENILDSIEPKRNNQLSIRSEKNFWHFKSDESTQTDEKIIIPEEARRKNIILNPNNSSLTDKDDEIAESKEKYGLLKTLVMVFKQWFDNEENKILKLLMVILIGIVITMFWYFHTTMRELRQQSQNGSRSNVPRSTDSNSSYGIESLNGGEFNTSQ